MEVEEEDKGRMGTRRRKVEEWTRKTSQSVQPKDKQRKIATMVGVDAREGGIHAKRECGSSPTRSKRMRARRSRPFQSASESVDSTCGATTKEDPRTSFPTPSRILCESSIVGNTVGSTKRWRSSRLSRSNLDRSDRRTHEKCLLPRMEIGACIVSLIHALERSAKQM